eukprot:4208125-Pyramimonas_sp.AAC.1
MQEPPKEEWWNTLVILPLRAWMQSMNWLLSDFDYCDRARRHWSSGHAAYGRTALQSSVSWQAEQGQLG